MPLLEFAREEMTRAGLYDADADYDGMIAKSVEELVAAFAAQGHSGYSAALTLQIFETVARFKPLTPLTSDPSEWMDVSEYSGGPMWQNRRSPSVFSKDGGQTWYDIDAHRSRLDRFLTRYLDLLSLGPARRWFARWSTNDAKKVTT